MVLGVWESIGWSLALTACQSLLGQGTGAGAHGRAQGLFAAGQTGATALSAAAVGALFGVAAWLPFVGAAGLCAVLLVAAAVIWRAVPGRAVVSA